MLFFFANLEYPRPGSYTLVVLRTLAVLDHIMFFALSKKLLADDR